MTYPSIYYSITIKTISVEGNINDLLHFKAKESVTPSQATIV